MNKGDRAAELFGTGLNCAQSVFVAFAEELGLDAETAARVSSGLGGGVGRMREVCGAVTGATLALGLKFGPDKALVYEKVQELMRRFKETNGSYVCRELLAGPDPKATTGGAPEPRTAAYYRKRPCAELVRDAATVCEEIVKGVEDRG